MNFLEFSLETMILALKRNKSHPTFVRDSNSSLKLLTFHLSNGRELETIKVYASWYE